MTFRTMQAAPEFKLMLLALESERTLFYRCNTKGSRLLVFFYNSWDSYKAVREIVVEGGDDDDDEHTHKRVISYTYIENAMRDSPYAEFPK